MQYLLNVLMASIACAVVIILPHRPHIVFEIIIAVKTYMVWCLGKYGNTLPSTSCEIPPRVQFFTAYITSYYTFLHSSSPLHLCTAVWAEVA